ncbi:MAG: FtsQ-type POTRA domain-containing protein, partial [bacterium]|nr:FtsQ-type POTRA domain-containing protein [bacterium]
MYNSSYNPGRQSMSKTRSDRKKRKQRKRRIILWLFTFFVFIVALAVLFLTCFFKIKVIKVSGVTRYSSEQIVENCGIKIDDNMLLVLQNNVKKTLSAKLPYIDDVKLIKKLDSSIEIRVTDAKAAYSIESGNNYYLLSEKLVVLETSTNPFENTVQLRGLEEQNYIVGSAVKISNTSLNETFSKLLSLIEENEIDIN